MTQRKGHEQLTPLELELMKVLWDGGPATVQEVQERVGATRQLAYTTVQTMLNILVRKKRAKRTLFDRAYRYRAAVSREKAVGTALHDLVERMFGGSAEALVLSLVESDQLTPETLRRLQKMVDAEEGKEERERDALFAFVVNAVWQSTLIAALGLATARLLRSARQRFELLALTLAAAVAAPLLTLAPQAAPAGVIDLAPVQSQGGGIVFVYLAGLAFFVLRFLAKALRARRLLVAAIPFRGRTRLSDAIDGPVTIGRTVLLPSRIAGDRTLLCAALRARNTRTSGATTISSTSRSSCSRSRSTFIRSPRSCAARSPTRGRWPATKTPPRAAAGSSTPRPWSAWPVERWASAHRL
jgi:predicted transcriptional regulator